jgi:CheY-like chemotaxis protein
LLISMPYPQGVPRRQFPVGPVSERLRLSIEPLRYAPSGRSAFVTPSVLIFLIEDEELIRELLQEALNEGGFEVTMASTGKEAMAFLDREGAEFSALITDVYLPGNVTGWDVARRARELNDALPVVYITGDSAHEWASKGVPNSQLLMKPFAPAQIVTAVSQLINAATSST